MIIWEIGSTSTLDFGVISLIPRFGVPPYNLNSTVGHNYLTQILKLGSRISRLPSFSQYFVNATPLYKIISSISRNQDPERFR